MIIIEYIGEIIKSIVRFFVWIITARDCDHCKNCRYTLFASKFCALSWEIEEKCKSTPHRCHFERKER